MAYFLTFRVGQEWYGIGVGQLIEVLHLVGLTEMPGTPPDVLGLLTLRDTVMPVVDLRLRFGLDEAPLHLDTHIIAIHTASGPMGLVVDDVDDVDEIADSVETHPVESDHVRCAVKQKGHLLMLLDVDHLRRETTALRE
jgi:purine-binding chemotaxis protein CheW